MKQLNFKKIITLLAILIFAGDAFAKRHKLEDSADTKTTGIKKKIHKSKKSDTKKTAQLAKKQAALELRQAKAAAEAKKLDEKRAASLAKEKAAAEAKRKHEEEKRKAAEGKSRTKTEEKKKSLKTKRASKADAKFNSMSRSFFDMNDDLDNASDILWRKGHRKAKTANDLIKDFDDQFIRDPSINSFMKNSNLAYRIALELTASKMSQQDAEKVMQYMRSVMPDLKISVQRSTPPETKKTQTFKKKSIRIRTSKL